MSTVTQLVAQSLGLATIGGSAPKIGATASGTTATAGVSVTIGATQKSATVVDYTDRIKKSGSTSIDALLAGGNRWWHTAGGSGETPSAVADHALSFSFMSSASDALPADANGFQALSANQKDSIRQALAYISTVADVSFTEVASGGDIQYGSNTQANSAGYARYPNEGAQVMLANNQGTFTDGWSRGSYEWETVLHETGHALGLKHPGNYNAGGGGTPGPYLSSSTDNRGNTLMSYKNASDMKRVVAANGGLTTYTVNPDTYQAYDMAALQYLYGAAASSSATYSWSAGAVFSQTIFNGNSASAIDLSNQTLSNVVDLRAGQKSSIALRDAYADTGYTKAEYAKLTSGGKKMSALLGTPTYTGKNNLTLAKGSHIDTATGGGGDDKFITNTEGDTVDGGDGNDAFFLTGGNASITGGNGDDYVYVMKKAGANWALSADHATLTLSKTDAKTHAVTTLATVALSGVEHIKYWNGASLKATGTMLNLAA